MAEPNPNDREQSRVDQIGPYSATGSSVRRTAGRQAGHRTSYQVNVLRGDFWPEEESIDEFLATFHEWRGHVRTDRRHEPRRCRYGRGFIPIQESSNWKSLRSRACRAASAHLVHDRRRIGALGDSAQLERTAPCIGCICTCDDIRSCRPAWTSTETPAVY